MNGITVTMAIVDFIPVLLFFLAAVLLQRDLYDRLSKGAFALLASGSILVLLSGVFKALWKVLYALSICDYQALDISFFPMQGPGFLLVFLSLLVLLLKGSKTRSAAYGVGVVPVFASNMPFVILQIVGCGGAQWCLFALALKMKRKLAAVLFVVAFLFMLGMGYLSAAFDDSSSMHWLAQCVNIVSQGAFLGGVVLLHRAGLGRRAE
ncbi:MAG: hypothetical protein NC131_19990 [Roseburia sp.]|nr:hypothetical protein [Roseburia sp.]